MAEQSTTILGGIMAKVQELIAKVSEKVPPEIAAVFIVGLLLGYLVGKFFAEDLMESETYSYLTGKMKLRE